jgi:hypothetical protein
MPPDSVAHVSASAFGEWCELSWIVGMKIVTMHQPNYLPWIGFFSKVRQSDCLIIADTFTMGGKSVFNRNKIRTANGWQYLTVPVGKKSEGRRICDVTMPTDPRWQGSHGKMIHDNYSRTPFFSPYEGFFRNSYNRSFDRLCELNEEIILFLFSSFDIDVEVLKASEMSVDPSLEKTDLMVALLKNAGADVYLSGPSGRDYLERDRFPPSNIQLKFFEFQHPEYPQRYPGF